MIEKTINTGFDYHENKRLLIHFIQAGRNTIRVKKPNGFDLHHEISFRSIVQLFLQQYPKVEVSWHYSPSGTTVSNFTKKEYKDLFIDFHDYFDYRILVKSEDHKNHKEIDIEEDISVYLNTDFEL